MLDKIERLRKEPNRFTDRRLSELHELTPEQQRIDDEVHAFAFRFLNRAIELDDADKGGNAPSYAGLLCKLGFNRMAFERAQEHGSPVSNLVEMASRSALRFDLEATHEARRLLRKLYFTDVATDDQWHDWATQSFEYSAQHLAKRSRIKDLEKDLKTAGNAGHYSRVLNAARERAVAHEDFEGAFNLASLLSEGEFKRTRLVWLCSCVVLRGDTVLARKWMPDEPEDKDSMGEMELNYRATVSLGLAIDSLNDDPESMSNEDLIRIIDAYRVEADFGQFEQQSISMWTRCLLRAGLIDAAIALGQKSRPAMVLWRDVPDDPELQPLIEYAIDIAKAGSVDRAIDVVSGMSYSRWRTLGFLSLAKALHSSDAEECKRILNLAFANLYELEVESGEIRGNVKPDAFLASQYAAEYLQIAYTLVDSSDIEKLLEPMRGHKNAVRFRIAAAASAIRTGHGEHLKSGFFNEEELQSIPVVVALIESDRLDDAKAIAQRTTVKWKLLKIEIRKLCKSRKATVAYELLAAYYSKVEPSVCVAFGMILASAKDSDRKLLISRFRAEHDLSAMNAKYLVMAKEYEAAFSKLTTDEQLKTLRPLFLNLESEDQLNKIASQWITQLSSNTMTDQQRSEAYFLTRESVNNRDYRRIELVEKHIHKLPISMQISFYRDTASSLIDKWHAESIPW